MLTDSNVVLYSIILSGLLSMFKRKDIQGKTCGCQMTNEMRNQLFQEMPQQRLLASGNMSFIASSVPIASRNSVAT